MSIYFEVYYITSVLVSIIFIITEREGHTLPLTRWPDNVYSSEADNEL